MAANFLALQVRLYTINVTVGIKSRALTLGLINLGMLLNFSYGWRGFFRFVWFKPSLGIFSLILTNSLVALFEVQTRMYFKVWFLAEKWLKYSIYIA